MHEGSFVFPTSYVYPSGDPLIPLEDGEQLRMPLVCVTSHRAIRVLKERIKSDVQSVVAPVKKSLIGPDKKLTRKEVVPFIRRMQPQLVSMGSVFKPMLEDGEQLDLGIKEDMYTQFKNQLMGEFLHTGVFTRKQAKEMLLGAMYGRTNWP